MAPSLAAITKRSYDAIARSGGGPLLSALQRVGDHSDAEVMTAYTQIQLAIERYKTEKQRDFLYQQLTKPHSKKPPKPDKEFAAKIVRLERRTSMKKSWDAALSDAASTTFNELNKVERRAVELLLGDKSKYKKNPIETRANILAQRIRPKWFKPTTNTSGRPKGARSIKGTQIDRVPISVEEAIETVLPIIESFAGTAVKVVVSKSDDLSEIKSPTLIGLVASVRTAIPSADVETIGRTVQLVRRKAKQRREKQGCKP